ncbi:hypothetical protein PUNSTDRAFT_144010 [Punctularia strigosozonata HHB-11173 SS5]|uniref:uncharacterized protein n=1 Tax=Punctularia strigosozonata (strain HHB-11173) TaxID=741275 RepID=UPI0004416960|nr:uncharacterized protein PUNSTDRAFT_144010 [Punctularia strigosozonata HHB-11173 SS5]EIN08401.1 hypothetical protein PUNSTDRAFT_144010 [Punctularia strigosozonata HHB-11173 SS5]
MSANMTFPKLDCFHTAVVVLPPESVQRTVNLLRSCNDKSFPRWTSHITMLFPFVDPSALPVAAHMLREVSSATPFHLSLDHVEAFSQKEYDTVYLAPSSDTARHIQNLWNKLSTVAGYKGRAFVPHLSLGQAQKQRHTDHQRKDEGPQRAPINFLREQGQALLVNSGGSISWDVTTIFILKKDHQGEGKMKVYDQIPLYGAQASSVSIAPESPLTFTCTPNGDWGSTLENTKTSSTAGDLQRLRLATYNVLHDPHHPATERFSLLERAIVSLSFNDVLCLQEVPTDLLPRLLGSLIIKEQYTFCTHSPTSVMPNARNIVVLSSGRVPFAWKQISLGANRHKNAAVLTLNLNAQREAIAQTQRHLILAVVHFTAGSEPSQVQSREREASALVSYLRASHPSDDCVIAGDMNLKGEGLPKTMEDHFVDAWTIASSTSSRGTDSGMTYEPARNGLASETTRSDQQAFRYDRICIRKGSRLKVHDLHVLNESSEEPASDHWPLMADLAWEEFPPAPAASIAPQEGTNTEPHHSASYPSPNISDQLPLTPDDVELDAFVKNRGGYPSEAQDGARTVAALLLQRVLAGSNSSSRFPSLASLNIPSLPLPSGVQIVTEVVGSRALDVDTAYSDIDILAVGNLALNTFFELSKARIREWNTICSADEMIALKRHVRDAAVQMMKLETRNVSVDLQYAPAARVLGSGTHLIILLARIVTHDPDNARCKSGYALLKTFFDEYAEWSWEDNDVAIPHEGPEMTVYKRTAREPMAILSSQRPVINVATSASVPTVRVVQQEFYRSYVQLELSFWGAGMRRIQALVGFVESRLVRLLLSLHASGNTTRLWPKPFMHKSERDDRGQNQSSLRLFYYVGTATSSSFLSIVRLQEFEDMVTQSSYYNPEEAFVSVSVVERARHSEDLVLVSELSLADTEEDDDSDTVTNADVASPLGNVREPIAPGPHEDDFFLRGTKPSKTKVHAKDQVGSGTGDLRTHPSEGNKAKLRTSADVYNRLMWDPMVNAGDYVVGYEDRFLGYQEVALIGWKRDIEDEAFIPFHRVVRFRRKSDNVIIWDRRSRIDRVFGSGG